MDNQENSESNFNIRNDKKKGRIKLPVKVEAFLSNHVEKLQVSYFNLILTVALAVVLMFIVAFCVFNANLKGEEQVMVPNVVGLDLGDALLEMQQKELYQKVQFRYTDTDDAGKILSQNPEAGAIVKAGRRIDIVVSKGMVLSKVENYVGENFDDVKIKLQTMFTGASRQLVTLADPSYKTDESPVGTILAQEPAEGTPISTHVTLKLLVSKGSKTESVNVPNLVGLSVKKIYSQLESSKVIFDFTSHVADSTKNEKVGTVTEQQTFDSTTVRPYTHCKADFALEEAVSTDEKKPVLGVFSAKTTKFPFAVEMTLQATKDGESKNLLTFKHFGGSVTIPYEVEQGTELSLIVNGKAVSKQLVN